MRSKVDDTRRGNGGRFKTQSYRAALAEQIWEGLLVGQRHCNLSPKKEIKEGRYLEDGVCESRILRTKLASSTILSRVGPKHCFRFRYRNVFCAHRYSGYYLLWSSHTHTKQNKDTDMIILILGFRDQLWVACFGHPDVMNLLVGASTWKSTIGGPLLFIYLVAYFFRR